MDREGFVRELLALAKEFVGKASEILASFDAPEVNKPKEKKKPRRESKKKTGLKQFADAMLQGDTGVVGSALKKIAAEEWKKLSPSEKEQWCRPTNHASGAPPSPISIPDSDD